MEGLVETDWTFATFTMNWQLTRADHPVVFEQGEPLCMVLPQRRDELESFQPALQDIRQVPEVPEVHEQAEIWTRRREQTLINKFLAQCSGDFSEYRSAWEQQYFRGQTPTGEAAAIHQTQLKLREFDDAALQERLEQPS